MNRTTQINKITIDAKGNVRLTLTEIIIVPPKEADGESSQRTNRYVAECEHKPHEDFANALLGLRKYALEICEAPKEESRTKYSITTVVISGDMAAENSRVMFSMSKKLKTGKVLNMSTPQVMMYGEEFANAKDMTKQIQKVIEEAFAYLGGKNADDLQLSFSFLKSAA